MRDKLSVDPDKIAAHISLQCITNVKEHEPRINTQPPRQNRSATKPDPVQKSPAETSPSRPTPAAPTTPNAVGERVSTDHTHSPQEGRKGKCKGFLTEE